MGALLVALLLGLVGCTGSDDPCATPDCRVAEVVALWEEDPDAAVAALGELSPEEAAVASAALIAEHPESSAQICASQTQGEGADWCAHMERRPHLWTPLPERADAQTQARRTAPGPAATSRLPERAPPSHLAEVPASEAPCPAERSEAACRTEQATSAARRQQPEAVAAACNALTQPEWVGECFFRAAEAAVQPRRSALYPSVVALCGQARSFSANCYWHTAMAYARIAPRADDPQARAWVGVRRAAEQIGSAWAEHDPGFGAHLQGFLWGRALSEAMAHAAVPDGTALALIPEEAAPHLRAALAAELLRREGADSRTLPEWVALARERLTAPEPPATARGPQGPPRLGLSSRLDHWPLDRPGDGDVPAVLYLGGSRRALSADLDEDLAVCVLEGAARQDPPAQALIRQGLADGRALVSWTAARLLASLAAAEK